MMSPDRTREDIVKALLIAREPNAAFELLLTGQDLDQLMQQIQAHAMGGGMEDDGGDYNEGDEAGFDHDQNMGGDMAALQQLANNPNFGLIRQRIMQDPQFYSQFIQSLQTQQPEMYNIIQ
jgi:hypothetical protein